MSLRGGRESGGTNQKGRLKWARSSVGEHHIDTVGVRSSILLAPTISASTPALHIAARLRDTGKIAVESDAERALEENRDPDDDENRPDSVRERELKIVPHFVERETAADGKKVSAKKPGALRRSTLHADALLVAGRHDLRARRDTV